MTVVYSVHILVISLTHGFSAWYHKLLTKVHAGDKTISFSLDIG